MHLSIIVPVYNSRQQLMACLSALVASSSADVEVIVVDDASTDDSAMVAAQFPGVQVYRLPQNSGPAAARNEGARHARGEILFFVDADVVVAPDAVRRVRKVFEAQPDLAAVFGSYDDRPSAPGVVSQYRNLLHHFVHQHGNPDASTFWAGCGAIRRAVFAAVGGFDAQRFPRPAIEDIELGYRLRRAGYRILLDKSLRGTHLKRWTLGSMIRTDLMARAIPWTRLLLSSGQMPNDLNVTRSQWASVALVGAACMALLLAAWWPVLFVPAGIALGGVVGLNWRLFAFFARRRGLAFACLCVPLHMLHYCCGGIGYLWSWGTFQAARIRSICSKQARLQAGEGGPA
ncbi:MAG: glycosyltransferase family 2 protein [Candidatus Binatia bacterium]|nr:glycosyltransferase family 2 protein [Candidatus Binatia bacterium]